MKSVMIEVKKWTVKRVCKTYAEAKAAKDSLEAVETKIHRQHRGYVVKAWYGEMQPAPTPRESAS